MQNRVIDTQKKNPAINPDETLKATSLLYLKDALINEQFEQCKDLIDKAKAFGAKKVEIAEVIAEYVQQKGSGQNEAVNIRRG